MDIIYEGIAAIGLPNVGVAIILFTIITKILMLPMTVKQQKSSKLQSIMQPEIQAIQNKYKGKTDQASMLQQQQDMKDVYEKYGTTMFGGCGQLLISMPILFGLYEVIMHMPGYISKLKDLYSGVADKFLAVENLSEKLAAPEFTRILNEARTKVTVAKLTSAEAGVAKDNAIDLMYSLSPEGWQRFLDIFNNQGLTDSYLSIQDQIRKATYFLGIDLSVKPLDQLWPGIFIPILAGLLQWLSSKMMQTQQKAGQQETDQQRTMNMMNIMFPIMSVIFCFSFSAGLGLYWVASAGVQVIVQLFVNNYMNKVDLNEMVMKNLEKVNEKRIKKNLPPKKVTSVTAMVHSLEDEQKKEEARKISLAEKEKTSTAYYEKTTTARKGSLAEKAGMVQQYEERQKQIKSGKKDV